MGTAPTSIPAASEKNKFTQNLQLWQLPQQQQQQRHYCQKAQHQKEQQQQAGPKNQKRSLYVEISI